ncbi:unnamed protein product [Strongylus vulgaris]|uniref:Uncharacterized protein n=1 Tax=Strongylus vulgaris TaxID=40348 RepID=A0A3P7IYE7_STRVU|nr:unnamed protein product [Strongylus vulgaris]
MADVGKALKDKVKAEYEKVAPSGQGNRFMDETGYENAKESASSAMDATKSGKGTYPTSNLGQTEENIRETTERKLDHLEKMAKKKV